MRLAPSLPDIIGSRGLFEAGFRLPSRNYRRRALWAQCRHTSARQKRGNADLRRRHGVLEESHAAWHVPALRTAGFEPCGPKEATEPRALSRAARSSCREAGADRTLYQLWPLVAAAGS